MIIRGNVYECNFLCFLVRWIMQLDDGDGLHPLNIPQSVDGAQGEVTPTFLVQYAACPDRLTQHTIRLENT